MQATKVKHRGERPDMTETVSWSCESECRSPRRLRTSPILHDTPSSHSSLPSLFCLSSPSFSSLGSVNHLPLTAVIFFFSFSQWLCICLFPPHTRLCGENVIFICVHHEVGWLRGLQKWRFNTGWIIKPPGLVTGTHSRTPKADSHIDHVATLLRSSESVR